MTGNIDGDLAHRIILANRKGNPMKDHLDTAMSEIRKLMTKVYLFDYIDTRISYPTTGRNPAILMGAGQEFTIEEVSLTEGNSRGIRILGDKGINIEVGRRESEMAKRSNDRYGVWRYSFGEHKDGKARMFFFLTEIMLPGYLYQSADFYKGCIMIKNQRSLRPKQPAP